MMEEELDLSLKDFTELREIGKGKDSKIYAATCAKLGPKRVAFKAYDAANISAAKQRSVKREARIMKYLTLKRVPNVVQFLGAFREPDLMCIVMERCSGGDLLERLLQDGQAMSEARVANQVASPLLATLVQLHRLGIIHRDIKLENIFIEGSRVKLGDFGLSICTHEEIPAAPVGTLEYMAPEVLRLPAADSANQDAPTAAVDEKVDVWSLGVTVFELVTGRSPFRGKTKEEVRSAILRHAMQPIPGFVSAACRDFLAAALTPSAARRPSAEALLKHSWLQLHGSGGGAKVAAAAPAAVAAPPRPKQAAGPPIVPPISVPVVTSRKEAIRAYGGTARQALSPSRAKAARSAAGAAPAAAAQSAPSSARGPYVQPAASARSLGYASAQAYKQQQRQQAAAQQAALLRQHKAQQAQAEHAQPKQQASAAAAAAAAAGTLPVPPEGTLCAAPAPAGEPERPSDAAASRSDLWGSSSGGSSAAGPTGRSPPAPAPPRRDAPLQSAATAPAAAAAPAEPARSPRGAADYRGSASGSGAPRGYVFTVAHSAEPGANVGGPYTPRRLPDAAIASPRPARWLPDAAITSAPYSPRCSAIGVPPSPRTGAPYGAQHGPPSPRWPAPTPPAAGERAQPEARPRTAATPFNDACLSSAAAALAAAAEAEEWRRVALSPCNSAAAAGSSPARAEAAASPVRGGHAPEPALEAGGGAAVPGAGDAPAGAAPAKEMSLHSFPLLAAETSTYLTSSPGTTSAESSQHHLSAAGSCAADSPRPSSLSGGARGDAPAPAPAPGGPVAMPLPGGFERSVSGFAVSLRHATTVEDACVFSHPLDGAHSALPQTALNSPALPGRAGRPAGFRPHVPPWAFGTAAARGGAAGPAAPSPRLPVGSSPRVSAALSHSGALQAYYNRAQLLSSAASPRSGPGRASGGILQGASSAPAAHPASTHAAAAGNGAGLSPYGNGSAATTPRSAVGTPRGGSGGGAAHGEHGPSGAPLGSMRLARDLLSHRPADVGDGR